MSELRDFSLTVPLRFGPDNPVIDYSLDWVQRYLDCSSVILDADDVWYFPGSRDRFLLKEPVTLIRYALHPLDPGEKVAVRIQPGRTILQQFLAGVNRRFYGEHLQLLTQILAFIESTGLVVTEDTAVLPGSSMIL